MPLTKAQEAARNADRLLKLFGRGGKHWTQGDYHETKDDGTETHCLIGGCQELGINRNMNWLAEAIDKTFDPTEQDVADTIIDFNDAESTKWPDIRALLRRIIRKAHSQSKRKEAA